MFYLARTYSTVGNHSEAFRFYKMLSQKSKWDQETYHGMVMMAEEGRRLGLPWQERYGLPSSRSQSQSETRHAIVY